jgi:hypothetical protein
LWRLTHRLTLTRDATKVYWLRELRRGTLTLWAQARVTVGFTRYAGESWPAPRPRLLGAIGRPEEEGTDMRWAGRGIAATFMVGGGLAFAAATPSRGVAQDSALQAKLAAVKQSAAANKQELAQYTWQQQQTISIKGQVKKQEMFSVQVGPDGKPVKTPLDSTPAASNPHGIKGHIVEKKEGELEDYAKQIGALAQSYMQPDPGRLNTLYQQGNISVTPGTSQLVIHNYVKQGDTVTMTLDPTSKTLSAVNVSSYLSKPSDAVTISGQFMQIPGGPNHVSSMTVNGVSKQLTVQQQNSNYQKLGSSSS